MRKTWLWFILLAAAGVVAAIICAATPRRAPAAARPIANTVSSAPRSSVDDTQERSANETASAVVRSHAQVPPVPDEEVALMARLHEIGETDPQTSLALAREGRKQFPRSPNAAELNWILVKSLVNLGRFTEARLEALRMVKKYPNTEWSNDVQRHLLTHPPGPPEAQEPEN